jgi:hypothetical protein
MRNAERATESEAGKRPASHSVTSLRRKPMGLPSDERSGHLAAALAFATVLAFTAHIARVATALAFATIEAFAVVFVHGGTRGGNA